MKTLVTGANGLLGTALRKYLGEDGNFYQYNTGKDSFHKRDLKFKSNADNYIEELVRHGCDTVIHCAARVGGIKANMDDNQGFFIDNYRINSNVLEASFKNGIKNFVSILSTCIFPDKDVIYPLTANQINNGAPHSSNYGYSYAKRLLGYQTNVFRSVSCNNWISVVPTNVYGECFSTDTDILMVDGIKNIKDIKIGDEIFTLNPLTKNIEIEKVIATQINHTNEFINLKSKGVDFKITEKHKIVYETEQGTIIKKEAKFLKEKIGKKYGQITLTHHNSYKSANEISSEYIDLSEYIDKNHLKNELNEEIRDFNHSGSKPYNYKFFYKDFVEFVGWYVSEGSYNLTSFSKGGEYTESGITRGQICISQYKSDNPENHKQIKNLLSKLGFNYGFGDKQFYFNSRLIFNYIEKNIGFGSESKKIPKEFLNINLSYELRRLLFDTLMKGDGNKNGQRYTTKSEILKDQFVYLCFGLGIKISNTIKEESGCWRIYICQKHKKRTVKYKSISTNNVENEKVYCITTEKNHIVYAGRNGVFNWIGQCDNFNLNDGHLIPALIHKAYLAKRDNTDFVIWGDGKPLRQFIYSDDLARAIMWALENWDKDSPFMAVNEREYSVEEIALIIARILDIDRERITFDSTKPSGQFRKPAKTDIPSDFKFTPLEEGISNSVDWFVKNYDKARK